MKIGIAGLGLIGGSMAKAYREFSNADDLGYEIYGYNRSRSITDFAILQGVLDGELNESTIPDCDLIFIGLYPVSSIEYM